MKYSLRRMELKNTVVFNKLAALISSVIPHKRTNATTVALVDSLYSCGLKS
jgi:hypothetical protein